MKRNNWVATIILGVIIGGFSGFVPVTRGASETIPLAGQWRFQLDRDDAGIRERWFERSLNQRIRLPGSLPEQGIGDDVSVATRWMGDIVDRSWFTAPEYAPYRQPGHIKVPFWLQPDKYYAGVAWYQRDLEIPAPWQGSRIVLTLERPHWETRVWIDDREAGSNNSLSTPHEYDLGAGLAPGKHRLTIRVDNRLVVDVGVNSHSITDHTQGNWNGIVGRIELAATPTVWLEDVQVFPDVAAKKIRVRVAVRNATARPLHGKLSLFVEPAAGAGPLPVLPISQNYSQALTNFTDELEIALGDGAQLWDEFRPALYRLRAELRGEIEGESFAQDKTVTFGLREISTQGTQFVLNGRKIFIRGTLECCIFPLTGHPPTDVESWRRVLRIARAHGLNLLRFHSWCPPEAAFVAADEMGFYYHVECASWANQSTTLGDGKPVDAWIYAEADRILKAYGNHPSFLLMPYGNEPGGKNFAAFLAKWVSHYRSADPRRLYTSGAGWPQIPENQFHVAPNPRVQSWGAGLKSRINARPPETRTDYRDYIHAHAVPIISHEIGEWCVYPNFEEIPKYRGYLKPNNFEIFRDSLRAHHLAGQARAFLLASGKLQTLCYKEDIESALRTPGMGGFELLDLHDFPGQGTALVGVLDPFWDDKGYVTAEEYHRFCGPTVPLARLGKRAFTSDEPLEADLEVAHFGPSALEDTAATWKLVGDDGRTVADGRLPARMIPVDNGIALGHVRVDLHNVPAPRRYKLVVGLDGTRAANDWDVWVYPPDVDTQPPPDVTIVEDLNAEALTALTNGGKVLWLVPPDQVKGDRRGRVALGFSSIFWNTAWTGRQPPHTLGILCNPKHPALADFPTDYHSNWQWWYLVSRSGAMILDDLPPKVRPIVQVIDDWFTNRKLGLVFEAKVGPGKLLVCSIDLKNGLDKNPVARQLRHSLLRYMAGRRFQPATRLTAEQARSLIAGPQAMTAGR
ncbi:MAG: sugar-binding domain-containing protein [Limisphaerales bacterium]